MESTTKPLRIALDQRLASYRAGGIARYAAELGDALSELSGIELTRIVHQSGRDSAARSLALRTPPHQRWETSAIGIELALRGKPFDIYHATDFIAPRLLRYPVVVTVHDLAFLRWPDQLEPGALRFYRQVKKQRKRTAHWITPSAWTRSEVINLLDIPEQDVSVIPHGVSRFVSRESVVQRTSRKPYILALGTVEPRKRYDLLLDAYLRLRPRPRLVIVGSAGWNTSELQERLRSTEGVEWHANAGDATVDRLLSEALALAIPSLAEGFGLGALEAMARGTPVISSGLGALIEVTRDAAHAPGHDEPGAWAQAIEEVIQSEDRWEELSQRGVDRAQQFTWERAARQTATIYRKVAG